MFDDYDVINPGPPLTEADLKSFEESRSIRIPNSFRSFLLWRNGGVPRKKGWPLNIAGWVELHWPDPTSSPDRVSDIGKIWKIEKDPQKFDNYFFVFKNGDIPGHILPVCRDGGGDLYFMDLREGDEPRVLFGLYLEPENAAVVAEDFTGFLAALKREDEV